MQPQPRGMAAVPGGAAQVRSASAAAVPGPVKATFPSSLSTVKLERLEHLRSERARIMEVTTQIFQRPRSVAGTPTGVRSGGLLLDDEEVAGLRQRSSQLEQQIRELEGKIRELEGQVRELQYQLKDSERLVKESEKKGQESERLVKESADKQRVADKNAELDREKAQDLLQDVQSQLRKKSDQVHALEKENEAIASQVKSLREREDRLRVLENENLHALEKQNQKQTEQLHALEKENDALSDQVKSLTERAEVLSGLQAELRNEKSQRLLLAGKLEEAERALARKVARDADVLRGRTESRDTDMNSHMGKVVSRDGEPTVIRPKDATGMNQAARPTRDVEPMSRQDDSPRGEPRFAKGDGSPRGGPSVVSQPAVKDDSPRAAVRPTPVGAPFGKAEVAPPRHPFGDDSPRDDPFADDQHMHSSVVRPPAAVGNPFGDSSYVRKASADSPMVSKVAEPINRADDPMRSSANAFGAATAHAFKPSMHAPFGKAPPEPLHAAPFNRVEASPRGAPFGDSSPSDPFVSAHTDVADIFGAPTDVWGTQDSFAAPVIQQQTPVQTAEPTHSHNRVPFAVHHGQPHQPFNFQPIQRQPGGGRLLPQQPNAGVQPPQSSLQAGAQSAALQSNGPPLPQQAIYQPTQPNPVHAQAPYQPPQPRFQFNQTNPQPMYQATQPQSGFPSMPPAFPSQQPQAPSQPSFHQPQPAFGQSPKSSASPFPVRQTTPPAAPVVGFAAQRPPPPAATPQVPHPAFRPSGFPQSRPQGY